MSQEPQHFAILIFPGFQALDAFGPLDILNILSISHSIRLSIIAESLQPVSNRAEDSGYKTQPASAFEQRVVPTHTYASPPDAVDVLIVPGGIGTRKPGIEKADDFVRGFYSNVKYIISVCTGAAVLARAGVLDGKRATTNKQRFEAVAKLGPNTTWVKKARWVTDGNVWTAAGVTAGMDATLAFVAKIWGLPKAEEIADIMEFDWHKNASWDPFSRILDVDG